MDYTELEQHRVKIKRIKKELNGLINDDRIIWSLIKSVLDDELKHSEAKQFKLKTGMVIDEDISFINYRNKVLRR